MTSSIVSRSFASVGIRIRQADRYVSLTDMATASGKRFPDWHKTKTAKSYIAALGRSVTIVTDPLIQINESQGSNETRGTWGHPKLALRFAQWCSDDFIFIS